MLLFPILNKQYFYELISASGQYPDWIRIQMSNAHWPVDPRIRIKKVKNDIQKELTVFLEMAEDHRVLKRHTLHF